MKKDERLQQLFQSIRAGELSRNRHYDLYLTADVLNARARSQRFDRLWQMLDQADSHQWQFQLCRTPNPQEHELICHSRTLEGSWRARLFDFELIALSKHPQAVQLIPQLRSYLDQVAERQP
jgi:hypothetical protein